MSKSVHFAGYDIRLPDCKVERESVDLIKCGDYGADPMPDGMFRMVPSGDIVDAQEKKARLRR